MFVRTEYAVEGAFWTYLRELVKTQMDSLMSRFADSGHGWQFIMEVAMAEPNPHGTRSMYDTREGDDLLWMKFYLSLANNLCLEQEYGCDFVTAKRNMLIVSPSSFMSTCDNVGILLNVLEHMMQHDTNHKLEPLCRLREIANKVAVFNMVSEIPYRLHKDIKNAYGISILPGAMRIPFVYGKGEEDRKRGEILLSFHGFPSDEMNLYIVDAVYHLVRKWTQMMPLTFMDDMLMSQPELKMIEMTAVTLADTLESSEE